MKIKRYYTLMAGALLISSSILAQKKESTLVDVKPTSQVVDATTQSLTYMLPKTSIRVDIEMEKTIKKAGPYYRYSQRYLNLSNVITEDSEEWVIKGVHIHTSGKADEDKRFSIFTKGNTSAQMLTLTPEGILAGINTSLPFSTQLPPKEQHPILSLDEIDFDNVALNEELLYKTSSAAMAQEAANMVYRLRSTRTNLLSGELENLPPDGEAYNTILKEIEKQEKDFVSLFAGKTITVSLTRSFELTPDPLSSYTNHVLCRFNQQKGLVDAMDITGTPIYFKMDVEKMKVLKNNSSERSKDPAPNGLFYNLPAPATITIVDKNTTIASKKVKLAQYGQVISMPPSVLSKESVVIEICPKTGALLSVSKQQ
ncbi:DUF4831 family protein [Saccharicrinis fermentans]|uniref:DUF4831 domain-containing protein n=1 Tax=Saccharicrinis fermentans DSM 9555 = JCM 21142 TaxID=869213 RepID=W7XU17_9BACT|nr:DUF4831 family protein [Saccharicrinis fermentans]GAF01515.1 hypothetical protein JCM21142_123 [Saccharicrinis fermentans DSM 9555 = JCM 21142]